MRREMLRRYEADRIAQVYTGDRDDVVSAKELQAMPDERKRGFEIVFGHVPYGIHLAFPQACVYATVLRDPVDRVVSSYYHHVRAVRRKRRLGGPALTPLEEAVESGTIDLAAFARGDTPRGAAPVRNQMVRIVSGRIRGIRGDLAHPRLLTVALENAEAFVAIGVTESVGDFAARLGDALGWKDRPRIPRVNYNDFRPKLADVPQAERDELRAINALDASFYEAIAARG